MNGSRTTQIFEYLYQNGNRKSVGATTIQVTYRPDWLDKVREDSGFLKSYTKYTQVSIGISLPNPEVIEVYFLFS